MKFGEPVGFPHMANTTMETWLQTGATGYDPFGTNATQAGCFLCHQLPTNKAGSATFSANFTPGQSTDDLSHFAGKLPKAKLQTFLKSLLSANSTAKAER